MAKEMDNRQFIWWRSYLALKMTTFREKWEFYLAPIISQLKKANGIASNPVDEFFNLTPPKSPEEIKLEQMESDEQFLDAIENVNKNRSRYV